MPSMSVYIGGLGEGSQKEDLEREFACFGNITKVWVARNPPGFAFIDFEDDDDADEAIKEMNGATINGSEITVDASRRGSKRGQGRGRGDGKKRKTRNSNKTEVVEIKIEDNEMNDNDDKNNDVTEKDSKEDKDKNKEDEDGYVWIKHRYMTCIKKSLLKFKCDQCDYATTTKGSLKNHMFTHSDDFPFSCPYCPYKGKRHTYLKRHMLHKHYNLCNMNMLRTPDEDYYES